MDKNEYEPGVKEHRLWNKPRVKYKPRLCDKASSLESSGPRVERTLDLDRSAL